MFPKHNVHIMLQIIALHWARNQRVGAVLAVNEMGNKAAKFFSGFCAAWMRGFYWLVVFGGKVSCQILAPLSGAFRSRDLAVYIIPSLLLLRYGQPIERSK